MHAPPFVPNETRTPQNLQSDPQANVATNERLISIGTGGVLLLNSLVGPRRSRPLALLLGAGLLYRGLTGHCHAYQMLGIDTAQREKHETNE